MQDGPQSLSNQEFLALLLRTGTKEESVIQLSNQAHSNRFEGLRLLKEASIEELTESKRDWGSQSDPNFSSSLNSAEECNNVNDTRSLCHSLSRRWCQLLHGRNAFFDIKNILSVSI